jgi:ABC-2 type transport system ATP-binding protein
LLRSLAFAFDGRCSMFRLWVLSDRGAMADPAISAVGLAKRYGDVSALEQVDIRVQRGEVYGFLGLNGAGKTTTIRLLLGMIRPTAGTVDVFGVRVGPASRSLWRRVGHMVESAVAYPELTVTENLEHARRLYGLPDKRAVTAVIERLGLREYAGRRAGTLSAGNLQRLGLARALLPEPDLLVLDEPANGLDPAGVVEVRELLRGLARERGVTVFMSSHILTEVDRLATRVGIIHRGRMLEELTAAELDRLRRRRLEIAARDLEAARRVLRAAGLDPVQAGPRDAARLELSEDRALERPDEIARLLVEAGVPPLRLAIEQEDIEEHFLRLTGAAVEPPR